MQELTHMHVLQAHTSRDTNSNIYTYICTQTPTHVQTHVYAFTIHKVCVYNVYVHVHTNACTHSCPLPSRSSLNYLDFYPCETVRKDNFTGTHRRAFPFSLPRADHR